MSTNNNNIFSDIAKLANSALATTSNAKNELIKLIKEQISTFMQGMDFIKRDEFENIKKLTMQNAMLLEKLTGAKQPNTCSHEHDACDESHKIESTAPKKKSTAKKVSNEKKTD